MTLYSIVPSSTTPTPAAGQSKLADMSLKDMFQAFAEAVDKNAERTAAILAEAKRRMADHAPELREFAGLTDAQLRARISDIKADLDDVVWRLEEIEMEEKEPLQDELELLEDELERR